MAKKKQTKNVVAKLFALLTEEEKKQANAVYFSPPAHEDVEVRYLTVLRLHQIAPLLMQTENVKPDGKTLAAWAIHLLAKRAKAKGLAIFE